MDDLIVIGAGPAGLSAGLFSGLYGVKTRVIGETVGGEVKLAPMIFDYPGVQAVKGTDWLSVMLTQVKKAGVEILEKRVSRVSMNAPQNETRSRFVFSVGTDDHNFETKALIFATGSKKRRPNYSGNQLARSLGISVNAEELINVNEKLATNIAGVFAAGNCLEHPLGLEQLVDAAAQGTRAAAQAYEYLKGKKAPILWGKAAIPNV